MCSATGWLLEVSPISKPIPPALPAASRYCLSKFSLLTALPPSCKNTRSTQRNDTLVRSGTHKNRYVSIYSIMVMVTVTVTVTVTADCPWIFRWIVRWNVRGHSEGRGRNVRKTSVSVRTTGIFSRLFLLQLRLRRLEHLQAIQTDGCSETDIPRIVQHVFLGLSVGVSADCPTDIPQDSPEDVILRFQRVKRRTVPSRR